ncbi:hypothetical protein P4N68_09420 [Corynebacterium felinum]|uniref:Membrane protein YccC n=2 Tax=Corynebacterium TaxID=1716 RepID=A0ABU2B881_9CORY|nr:hypothetical protein [Corynebacterium felinum]MDF5821294.1 hypothetical protein [Corynebacterium felinum]MDR7354825.1 putative membrane protein YccC [Corynebacterium felinum]
MNKSITLRIIGTLCGLMGLVSIQLQWPDWVLQLFMLMTLIIVFLIPHPKKNTSPTDNPHQYF